MKKVEIKKAVAEILDKLCDRSGFDDWYFNLNDDTQEEIERELFETVNRRVNKDVLPCDLDHNGECLICDCWFSDCAYNRMINEDYKWETKEELEKMFKDEK